MTCPDCNQPRRLCECDVLRALSRPSLGDEERQELRVRRACVALIDEALRAAMKARAA